MGATCDITVTFHAPPADLAPCFTTFYRADFTVEGGTVQDALQPEWGGIRIFSGSQPQARIGDGPVTISDMPTQGPTTRPIQFEVGTSSFWGIGLLPLGWATFMQVPANEMANRTFDGRSEPAFAQFVPLADRLSADPAKEAHELDEIIRFFREDVERQAVDSARILAIHEMLLDPAVTDVTSMAKRAGLSQRTLERISRRVFGFPPKMLMRRQRFMRSLAQFMANPSIGWINAMDESYFDQSQFVRDARAFLRMSPSEYAAQDHPVLTAFMRERQRALGSPVQTLDKPD